MRCVYNSPKESLNNLLSKNGDCNIQMQNLQSLMTLIYKISKNDSPEITSNLFKFKELSYNLRSKLPIELTKLKTINYDTNTVCFKGALLWNDLLNKLKELDSLKSFKKEIKKWRPKVCTCKICS